VQNQEFIGIGIGRVVEIQVRLRVKIPVARSGKGLTAHLGKPVDATALATLIEQLTAKRLERTAG